MQISRVPSLKCIKPNAASVVKPTLLRKGVWVLLLFIFLEASLLGPLTSWAANDLPPPPEEPPSSDAASLPLPDDPAPPNPSAGLSTSEPDWEKLPLPDIIAKTFDVKVVRRSNSNKVYVFDDKTHRQPKVGRILLMKREEEPFLALRVLRLYPENNTFAAKWIKRYGKHATLENDEAFLAIEKISDLVPPVPTAQDNADLKELESLPGSKATGIGSKNALGPPPAKGTAKKTSQFDPDLDGGVPPPPEGINSKPDSQDNSQEKSEDNSESDSESDAEKLSEEEQQALSVDEVKALDNHLHWLTAGFGYVINYNSPATGGFYSFSAGNLRYGISAGRRVFFDQEHAQDSIVPEVGFFLYKGLNYMTQGDAYTVLTLVGTLRYNLMFSETFGIFVYGGILKSTVVSSVLSQDSALEALNSILPSGGAGILFQIGPSWYTRVDVGIDAVNLNLVLRF